MEITALEKYLETGKKEEAAVEGEYKIVEEEEETDDEGREESAGAGVEENTADAGRSGSVYGDRDQQTEEPDGRVRMQLRVLDREKTDDQAEAAGGVPGQGVQHLKRNN